MSVMRPAEAEETCWRAPVKWDRGAQFRKQFWVSARQEQHKRISHGLPWGMATPEGCSDKARHGRGPGRAFVRARAWGQPVCRGLWARPWVPEAGTAQGDRWERPVEGLGHAYHMAWLADLHSRWGRHRAPPPGVL